MIPYQPLNYRVYCWFELVVVGEERDVDTGKRRGSFFALLYSSRLYFPQLSYLYTPKAYLNRFLYPLGISPSPRM